ncbi:MAG: RCC1 domain-containing protein [Sandaracinaceae bacterium]
MKRVRAIMLFALGLVTACQPARDVSFSIQLPSGVAQTAERVVVSIHTDASCAGAAIYSGTISLSGGTGMAASMPDSLPPGDYYFRVEARDGGCSVLAEVDCQQVSLPIETDSLTLAAVGASGEACPAEECMNGMCPTDMRDAGTPMDAGPDTGPQTCGNDDECTNGTCRSEACCFGCWDGSSCQTGNATGACGAEGQACSACGSGQTCNAGRCEVIPGEIPPDLALGVSTSYVVVDGDLYSAGANGENLQRGALVSSTPNVFSRQETELQFAFVATMETTGCGITTDGGLHCWGSNIAGLRGQGTGDADPQAEPQQVGIDAWTDIEAGNLHFCAIRRDDSHLLCWGQNANGRLGFEGGGARFSPTDVDPSAAWMAVSAGEFHTCAIRSTGELYCWGTGADGQLGVVGSTDDVLPTQVGGGSDWTAVSAGAAHTCGIRSGDVYCWGNYENGRLGAGELSANVMTPALVDDTRTWVSVSAGQVHSCGLTDTGEVLCWGLSRSGETGLGMSGETLVPTRVAGGFDAVEVSWEHSCGIRTDASSGLVVCWGKGEEGRTGSGDTGNQPSPGATTFVPSL